ncbi:hypothetical protein ACFQ0M_12220 [Kitasatospora aburaviensis]
MVGAHLLGLDAANKTMLRSFASSAAGAPDHMPYWAVNFDAKTPLSIDYHSPTSFVRELPAAFELAQKINEAYGWTGDTDYLDDPALSGFVAGTVGPYVTGHTGPIDNGGVPVAQATSGDIFQGVASYNENGATLAESGDAVASQYQAYLAAAALATAKGNADTAAGLQARAATLKTYFNTSWSVDPANPARVVRAYDVNGTAYSDWGKENSWFIPLKGIMDPGQRQNDYLAWIDAQASGAGAPENLEAATYLPDVFFAHNQGATGWKWMQYVHDRVGTLHSTGRFLNGDYPEIAFTLLGQTVQGLMGVQPDAAGHALSTTSRLPSDIGWLQLTSVPVGSGTVTLRHDGVTKSALTNTSGTGSLTWTARFAGTHSGITVDGAAQPPAPSRSTASPTPTPPSPSQPAGPRSSRSPADRPPAGGAALPHGPRPGRAPARRQSRHCRRAFSRSPDSRADRLPRTEPRGVGTHAQEQRQARGRPRDHLLRHGLRRPRLRRPAPAGAHRRPLRGPPRPGHR